jgi:hypothetical protein
MKDGGELYLLTWSAQMDHRRNDNGVLRSLKEAYSKELLRFSNLQRLLNLRTDFACNAHECLRGTSTLIAGLTE